MTVEGHTLRNGTILGQYLDVDDDSKASRLWITGVNSGIYGETPTFQEIPAQNCINVRSLGADPTGVTESGAIINKAIAEASTRGYARVYIPSGLYLIEETIVLDSLIWLHGDGMGTVLFAKENLNAPVIQGYLSTGTRFGYMQRISDLRIDGNRYNQNSPTGAHGIEWIAPAGGASPTFVPELVTTNPTSGWFDTNRDAFNLFIGYCGGTGFWMEGRGGMHGHNIYCYENKEYGFRPTYDTAWANCTAGRNQKAGFYIAHSAIKMTGCKSWWSGYQAAQLEQYLGNGWHFTSQSKGSTLVGCEAQDNWDSGYWYDGAHGHLAYGCVADSNNRKDGDGVGVKMRDAHSNVWEGMIYDRLNDATRYQRYAIHLTEDCYFNKIVAKTQFSDDLNAFQQYDNKFHPDSDDGRGNTIVFDSQEGSYGVGNTATIQPGVYQGGRIFVDINQNMTVNTPLYKHVGAEIEYIFLNDGVGGHTLTFDSNFRVAPAWSYSATAGKVNVAKFIWSRLGKWVMTSFTNNV
jgi:hypothetical protein